MLRTAAGVLTLALLTALPWVHGQDEASLFWEAGDFNYTLALEYSFLFYEAQRSGKLPDDQRVTWRGDSILDDATRDGDSLAGGYYDAGDALKITHPLAVSLGIVAWSVLEFRDSYVQANQYQYALEMLRWGLDWLLKAHSREDQLVIQVGSSLIDHKQFHGPPERMNLERPVYVADGADKPASDVAALAAAALAAGSIVFEDDASYQRDLLGAAKSLYTFAVKYKGRAVDWLPASEARLYNSSHVEDDMMWAAAWLFKATLDGDYYRDAKLFYNLAKEFGQYYVVWNWDNMYWGGLVMLQKIELRDYEQEPDPEYQAHIDRFFASWMEGDQKAGIQYLSEGFGCIDTWGVNRETANAAALAYLWGNNPPNEEKARGYRCWAQSMLDWLLGRNKRNQSYMVGWNDKFPLQAHHRGAACPNWADPKVECNESTFNANTSNPHILYGAMVMGRCGESFPDNRTDYETAEVALDVNAGLTAALSAIVFENRCYGSTFKAPAPGEEAANHLPAAVATNSKTVSGSIGAGNLVDPSITAAALAQAAEKLGAKLVLNDGSGTISSGGQIVRDGPASASFDGPTAPVSSSFSSTDGSSGQTSLPWLENQDSSSGSGSDSRPSYTPQAADTSSNGGSSSSSGSSSSGSSSSSNGRATPAVTASGSATPPTKSAPAPAASLTVATPSKAKSSLLMPPAEAPLSVLAQLENFMGGTPVVTGPPAAPTGPDENEIAGQAMHDRGKAHEQSEEQKRRANEAAREAADRESAAFIDAQNRIADAQRRGLPIPQDAQAIVAAQLPPPPPEAVLPMNTDLQNDAASAFDNWNSLQDIVNGRRLLRRLLNTN